MSSQAPSRPIAYVMEQTLGSVTHYLNLRRQEAMGAGALPRWLPIEWRDTRLPWTIAGSLLAREAVAQVAPQVDGVFCHTTTISLLAFDFFGRKPTVLSTDGTPLNKRSMRGAYGLGAERSLAERAKRAIYGAAFRRAVACVAWSNWVKQSFIEDYGCREQDVMVIPPGVDLDDFAPGDRSHAAPRLLFVGGDFQRKGGDLLLEVFQKRLQGRAALHVVTGADVPAIPGVTVHKNLAANSPELRKLYATCDVFVLPTRADCYSLVCIEALASGLPVVATRVGGIPEIVREGETGHLIDPDDPAALGDALEDLIADRSRLQAMGARCRAEASARFDARRNARRLFEFVRERCQAAS
jgi:glycosyltransferase involved in cell wall biosynthesis